MIYVECKPDFELVRCITGIPKRGIIHESNKPGVCKKLEKQSNCKGMVDEDPGSSQPPYISRLILKDDLFQDELKVYYDRHRNNYLIVLCPKLEDWILKTAKQADLDVDGYSLPKDPNELHRNINIRLDNFKRLLADLNEAERIKTLRKLLEG